MRGQVDRSDLARRLIDECLSALRDGAPVATFHAIVADAVAAPEEIAGLVSLPLTPDEDLVLYRSDMLTITQSVFPAGFQSGLHDHGIPAVIGVWSGYEDNFLFRRSGTQLVDRCVVRVHAGQVLTLDSEDVHDVHGPPDRFTGAIHVYLGDLFGARRHEWADTSSTPSPFDLAGFADKWSRATKAAGLRL